MNLRELLLTIEDILKYSSPRDCLSPANNHLTMRQSHVIRVGDAAIANVIDDVILALLTKQRLDDFS